MCNRILLVGVITIIVVLGCSKKTVPSRPEEYNSAIMKTDFEIKKADSLAAIRRVIKSKVVTVTPKVIVVNDQFAKKSVDGRYFYDLQGHRYWRSNKDGKYYIFNKTMATDPAFKKPNK